MRLADEINQTSIPDPFGFVRSFAAELAKAECFDLDMEIRDAARQVARRTPSSIITARDLVRAPYPLTWLEWPGTRGADPDSDGKVPPTRLGVLIEAPEDPRMATLTRAWSHEKDGATVWPISMRIDFRPGADLHEAAEATIARARGYPELQELIGRVPEGGFAAFWERILQADLADFKGANRAREEAALRELYRSLLFVPSTHSMPMWALAMQQGRGRQFMETGLPDIAGEVSFCIAALLLLNTVNGINRQREDLSQLNRARVKRGRVPLREFVVTRLRLGKVVERGLAASGLSRQEARRHWVRGHFKVRATGVFWWSPYIRNRDAPSVVNRDRYTWRGN